MKSTGMVAIMVAGATALTACSPIPADLGADRGRTLMIPLTGAAEGPGRATPMAAEWPS